MEYLGVFAFIMVISYMGLPGKVNHLETKVKRLNVRYLKPMRIG